MGILGIFKKKQSDISDILWGIHGDRGILWESIAEFKDAICKVDGALMHHTPEMESVFPLEHHIKDGLYTRQVKMPKGSLVVSFIHKTNHPSFFMSGEMSILEDNGNVKRITAPMVVQTSMGTQRVAYMHEDCVWSCVYKTDKNTVEEAEKEIYTEDYRDLPAMVIEKQMNTCLDS